MSGVEAVDIIVEHRLHGFFTRAHPSREGYDSVTRCTCHWVSYEDAVGEMQAWKIHAEHLVSVLAEHGYSIVPSDPGTCVDDPMGTHRWMPTNYPWQWCPDCRLRKHDAFATTGGES